MKHHLNLLWQSLCVTVLAFALSYVVSYDISSISAFASVEEAADIALSDVYNAVAQRRAVSRVSDEVVLVGIDSCTRNEIAAVLQVVDGCDPKAVGLDVMFAYPTQDDTALIAALDGCRNLVLPMRVRYDAEAGVFGVAEQLYFSEVLAAKQVGVVNLSADYAHQLVRDFRLHFPLTDGSAAENFVVALARVAAPERHAALMARGAEEVIIRYPSVEFESLSARELFDEEGFPSERAEALLRDRLVLVGALHDSADCHPTPVHAHMAGLRIHAHALQTILSGNYLRHMPEWAGWLLATLFCLRFSGLNMWIKYDARWNNIEALGLRVVQMGLMYGFLVVGCWWFIRRDGYLDFSASLLMIGLSALASDVWMGLRDVALLAVEKIRLMRKNN